MKRFFTHRFPIYGTNHEKLGPVVMQVGIATMFLAGYLVYKAWDRIESKKVRREKNYEKVDPNQIVPYPENITPVDHEKLKKVVIEGDDYIRSQLKIRLISKPEEFVLYQTKGVQDEKAFLKYLTKEFRKLPKEKP